MRYRRLKGYKYQLEESEYYNLPSSFDGIDVSTNYIIIVGNRLMIKEGYAWDGPSGPTIDTKTFMYGSLVHDSLYQLIRQGLLQKRLRIEADRLLRQICIKYGMSKFRAWYVYRSVRAFGWLSVMPRKEIFNEIVEA